METTANRRESAICGNAYEVFESRKIFIWIVVVMCGIMSHD